VADGSTAALQNTDAEPYVFSPPLMMRPFVVGNQCADTFHRSFSEASAEAGPTLPLYSFAIAPGKTARTSALFIRSCGRDTEHYAIWVAHLARLGK
jgi:hypothetical protein